MARSTSWLRLVRYVSALDGRTRYGEPMAELGANLNSLISNGSLTVHVLEGPNALSAKPTGENDTVQRLLGPLTPAEVPIIRCTGLNYRSHILGTGAEIPQNPTLFIKCSNAIADTNCPIPIPKLSQNALDFEGELTVLISKDAKDVPEEKALEYVAGYMTSNDVSCRDWQMQPEKAGPMPQWCFSKSFDNYAPLGPVIVSSEVLGDASGLELKTWVNGTLRQQATTSDLVFGVRKLVSFFSQGTTLKAGSLIMTGTPGGVNMESSNPNWLQDGDEVVVEIEGIGALKNTMKFT